MNMCLSKVEKFNGHCTKENYDTSCEVLAKIDALRRLYGNYNV